MSSWAWYWGPGAEPFAIFASTPVILQENPLFEYQSTFILDRTGCLFYDIKGVPVLFIPFSNEECTSV